MRVDSILRDKLKKINEKNIKKSYHIQRNEQLKDYQTKEKEQMERQESEYNLSGQKFKEIINTAKKIESKDSSPQEMERNREEFLTTLLNFIGQQTSSSVWSQQQLH